MSQELKLKLLIIGDSGVGKTSILLKYVDNFFTDQHIATIGVEYKTKVITKGKYKIQIWDTAGQERYRSITSAYYKGAKGALIVYDITRKNTFDNIDKWISDLKLNGDKNICILIVGNKSDLNEQREVDEELGKKKAEMFKTAFMETSALNGENISKAFEEVIEQIYQLNKNAFEENAKKDIDRGVNLNENKDDNKKKCC